MTSVIAPNSSSTPKAAGIPWFGLVAVLMGTFISTLNGRLSNFGLADIRGSLGAGFDEGAWITTAQAVGQMLIAPVAVWAGATFGPRRCLIVAASAFAWISLIIPMSRDLPTLLTLQFGSGLASGFFIPLTLSFILPNSPPKCWAFALALYALNLELSLNIAASLEGWYVEHLSWHWIFWQNIPFAVLMALCLRLGVARDPIKPTRPPADIFGMTFAGLGLALIYAGLDQGNRLDWLSSGTVVGLLASGALLFAAFFIHEARTPHPLINLRVALGQPIPGILLLIVSHLFSPDDTCDLLFDSAISSGGARLSSAGSRPHPALDCRTPVRAVPDRGAAVTACGFATHCLYWLCLR